MKVPNPYMQKKELLTVKQASDQMLTSGINVCLISQSSGFASPETMEEWQAAAADMFAELERRGVKIEKRTSGPDSGLYKLEGVE